MSTTIFFERFYRLCKTHRTSPNAVGAQLGLSSGSITAWKHGAMPRPDTIQKLADHFGVPVDYLLGKDAGPHSYITDAELKFALFGGDAETITDEMLDEVRRFAAFLQHRKQEN